MSMIGEYRRITHDQLYDLQEALQRDQYAVFAFLYPEGRSYEKPDSKLTIGRAWHGLHFLLNGAPWDGIPPLVYAVLGGTDIGDDLGYGAVRYLTPEQVKEVKEALDHLDRSELRNQFSAVAFEGAGIYPGGWTVGEAGKAFDWSWKSMINVRSFFTDAAYFGDVMLLYLS